MNELSTFSQHGRKGIAYDWQSLYAPQTSASPQGLDREIELGFDLVLGD